MANIIKLRRQVARNLRRPVLRLLQRAVTRYGYTLRFNDLSATPSPITQPVDVFALAVQDLMRVRGPQLSFVQIGAHDGKHHDPLRPFIEQFGWRGLLVEPQPAIFEQLQRNYADFESLSFERAAIVSDAMAAESGGEIEMHVFDSNSPLPEHATMLASINRDWLENNGHGYQAAIQTLRVPCLTPLQLLERHGIEDFDVLQTDTESFDGEILMAFDFTRWKPAIIHCESAAFSPQMRRELYGRWERAGYSICEIGIDTLAYRQSEVFSKQTYSLTS